MVKKALFGTNTQPPHGGFWDFESMRLGCLGLRYVIYVVVGSPILIANLGGVILS